MNEKVIRDRLVERGEAIFRQPKKPIRFTGNIEADEMLNNLEKYPHAFVLACIMDRQIKAERAWMIPFRFNEKLGGFSIKMLGSLSRNEVRLLMSKPEPLHRFIDTMSIHFYSGIQRIINQYQGDASKIWHHKPSSAEVVYKFLEFDGVGPKIGSMAANILAREMKIPLKDHFSIDISPDVHVKRVFVRLGLCGPEPSPEQIIYKARALHPEFPGIMDLPAFEMGRNWCRPNNAKCDECYMVDICPNGINCGEK